MNLLKHVLNILFSTKVTGTLLIIFASSMAIATFIENDYNTETAKALVYNATWFEVLLLLISANFIGNIYKYKLFSWKKAPIFLFHIAFIIIILGAGITRYRGYEGLITIKEGELNDKMVSVDSYIQAQVSNGNIVTNFISSPLFMSELGSNTFQKEIMLDSSLIKINLKKYIPKAKYILEDNKKGKTNLHIVIANNQERKDFYIEEGTREHMYGIPISFNYHTPLQNDIIIKKKNNQWLISYPEITDYFDMLSNKASSFPKDTLIPLQLKVLNNFKGSSLVFNEIRESSKRALISDLSYAAKKNPESAIILEVASGKITKQITLFGGPGYANPPTNVFINGFHLNLRYGSKVIKLPFNLYLSDFILERYPGSESPSAFYSKLEVQDKNKLFYHTIFMNNVMNYRGYRFFQSAYTPDELGTILSVNHDYWGTLVTYIGYGLLGLGMLLTLLWKSSHFGTTLTIIKQNH
ncbi:cytochrome c biogenesis protein ResB [Aquimarina sp. D1M17]|uniref:cytochrome c biogenesis protein ResB n=1 Tax=Aquimarina acroporae TaxID=2937283 RepID=UPI0020C0F4EF|nr:cytochrome c biogenesis protein ResB [Aquimarina acroporae]MCK8523359.1 cytochrome c biogenesis protein ResB [Aquimarina acroporae]